MDINSLRAKELLENQHLAVLCTQGDHGPYASLMAYAYDRKMDAIYLVTRKDSEKYHNMVRQPRVALLVDNRNSPDLKADGVITSLTVQGTVSTLEQDVRQDIRPVLAKRFPPLTGLLQDQNTLILCILLDHYLLLEGPEQAVRGTFRARSNHR